MDKHALQARLAEFEGTYAVPQRGCQITRMPLGNASVLVEFEMQDGDALVINVLINGMWIDAEDYLSTVTVRRWEETLSEDARNDAGWQRSEIDAAIGRDEREFAMDSEALL